MHVIQTFGADGDLLDETEYTDREAAFAAYDEACRKADGRGKTAGVVMSEGGNITHRHGTIPVAVQAGYRAPKTVKPEKKVNASTDVPATPAADDDVRERPRDKDTGTGDRGRNGRPNPGRGKVSTAPVTVAERDEPETGFSFSVDQPKPKPKTGTVSTEPVTAAKRDKA
jgi:hypothetical protein